MIDKFSLLKYLNDVLKPYEFEDYCPNGLQIEGDFTINKIITGVSICDELIESAIKNKANAIIVHHGIFWFKDDYRIYGVKKERIKKLLEHGINLYAYHLPLDNHQTLGNNIQLANLLDIEVIGQTDKQNLLWYGRLKKPILLPEFKNKVNAALKREPLILGKTERVITDIAWCTGGAVSMFNKAIDLDVDLYITGEVSEHILHLANESGVVYMAAGHYATERYGIMALTKYLGENLKLDASFIEIYNPV